MTSSGDLINLDLITGSFEVSKDVHEGNERVYDVYYWFRRILLTFSLPLYPPHPPLTSLTSHLLCIVTWKLLSDWLVNLVPCDWVISGFCLFFSIVPLTGDTVSSFLFFFIIYIFFYLLKDLCVCLCWVGS